MTAEASAPTPARASHRLRALGRSSARAVRWSVRRGLQLMVLAYFVAAAVVLVVKFGVLPRVPEYREEIARTIAASIGEPVSIGSIDTGWTEFHPTLSIRDFKIHGRDGAVALALPSVWGQVSWRSLLFWDLRFRSIIVSRPELDVRRAVDGKLYVGGIELKDAPGRGPGLGDWVLRQSEILIDDGAIQWRDEVRAVPVLALRSVSLRLVNRFGNQHRIALYAVPAAGFASPVDVRADLRGESLDALANWSGRLYADLEYAELGAWRAWLDYPVNVTAGRGRVRAWFDVADGHVTHATADVALTGVEARLARELPPLRLDSVSGRLGIAEGRPGRGFLGFGGERTQSVSAFGQTLALAQHGVAPVAPFDFTVRWEPATAGSPERGDARATRIDLAPLAALAESLPLPRAVRDALGRASPRGRLTDLTVGWTGSIDGPDTYRARAQFAEFAMNPVGALPGLGPLAGVLQMTEVGGNVKLDGANVLLDFPRLFKADTIPSFDTVSAQVDWTLTSRVEGTPHLDVRVPAFKLANVDFAASGAGSWRALARGPGQLELAIDVPRATATAVHRYFAFLPERAYEWLKRSLQAGEGTDGHIRFKGDLIAFPYATPQEGLFQIATRFTGGQLQFHPEWPKIEGIDGEFAIDGRALSAKGQAGSILGVKLGPSTVQIAELLGPQEAIVEVNSSAEGPTAEFRKYILESPLRENVGRVLADMSGDGLGRMRLGLTVPLRRVPETRVQGSYQFVGNRVSVAPDQPPFTDVNGQLEFTERTLSANGLNAQFLGGPGSLSIATQPNAVFVITGQGTASAAAVNAAYDLPFLGRARGQTAYRAQLTVSPRSLDLAVDSNLQGVAVDLPAPFGKAAGEALVLKVTRVFDRDPAGRDGFTLTAGDLVAVNARFKREESPDAVRRVPDRIAVGLGVAAPPLPSQTSIVVAGELPWIDLDTALDAVLAEVRSGKAAPAREAVRTPKGPELPVGAITIAAKEMVVLGRRLTGATLRAVPTSAQSVDDWQVAVGATELAGDIRWQGAGRGNVTARFKHLTIPDRAVKVGAQGQAKADDPLADLPSLDVIAESFTLNAKQYGQLRLVAANEDRAWRIRELALTAPEGTLRADGVWQPAASGTRTEVTVRVDVKDAGGYLARMGQPAAVKGGTATLEGQLAWAGPPVAIDYPTLSGSLKLHAERGQFLKVDPGVGRLLGVLSLQSLPRRMTLDFRDVFSDGFAFDDIAATAVVARGVATTQDFRMVGPAAAVALKGDADLGRETQNFQVRVVPVIGDSVAAVAGLALLNPVVGLTTFLAQRLLRDPLGQLLAYEYQVSGGWGDPKVERVLNERRSGGLESETKQ